MTRADRLKHYGLTEQDYLRMLDAQDGRCAICRSYPKGNTPGKNVLAVDHKHIAGEQGPVRGLLCLSCNVGLGYFNDDTAKLLAAVRYLTGQRGSLKDLLERYDENDFNCHTNASLTERDEEDTYETH